MSLNTTIPKILEKSFYFSECRNPVSSKLHTPWSDDEGTISKLTSAANSKANPTDSMTTKPKTVIFVLIKELKV